SLLSELDLPAYFPTGVDGGVEVEVIQAIKQVGFLGGGKYHRTVHRARGSRRNAREGEEHRSIGAPGRVAVNVAHRGVTRQVAVRYEVAQAFGVFVVGHVPAARARTGLGRYLLVAAKQQAFLANVEI